MLSALLRIMFGVVNGCIASKVVHMEGKSLDYRPIQIDKGWLAGFDTWYDFQEVQNRNRFGVTRC
jgi:hypothetical protein